MSAFINAIVESRELAWALLHSLWMGAALCGALWLAFRLMPASNPHLRYCLSLACMAMLLVGTTASWAVLRRSADAGAATDKSAALHSASTATAAVTEQGQDASVKGLSPVPGVKQEPAGLKQPAAPQPAQSPAIAWEVWITAAWFAGAAVMLMRVLIRLASSRCLRRESLPCDNAAAKALLDEARRLAGVARRVQLRLHRTLKSPAVVGIIRPIILLPFSAVTGMSAEQLRVVLLHELAHIRRHDLLVQVCQMLMEAIFFFNPSAWWISRVISQEREACADQAAARQSGKPAQYVETLVALAAPSPEAAAALAFARRPLLDRARRLLEPSYRPVLCLPWRQALLAVAVSAVVLAGLWKGTAVAVEIAAEVLSPRERVEKIAQADRDYGLPVSPAASQDKYNARVSGRVIAADGSALRNVTLTIHSQTQGHSSVIGHDVEQGVFDRRVPAGEVWIWAKVEGLAPSGIGPFRVESSAHLENLEIVLQSGHEAKVRCVDPDGAGLEGVTLRASVTLAGQHMPAGSFVTAADGTAELTGLTEMEYSLNAERDGYEPLSKQRVRIGAGDVITLQLTPAQPLVGAVVGPEGRGVSGATIRLFATHNHSSGPHGPVLATTDEQGKFELTTLARESLNALYVEHDEVGRVLVRDVKVSAEPLQIVLRPLTVRGRVIGDLTKLQPNRRGELEVSYGMDLKHASNSSYSFGMGKSPVDVVDGVGRFQIQRLPQGNLSVTAGDQTERLMLTDAAVQEITIDLDKPPLPVRSVVLRLLPPEGQPIPRGTISLKSNVKGADLVYKTLELADGEASIDAYVGGNFAWSRARLIGAYLPKGSLDEVPPGDGPLVLERQAYPAGAIAGRVLGERDQPLADSVQARLHVQKQAPLPDLEGRQRFDVNDIEAKVSAVTGSFMLTPLPLGGVYRVVASRGRYYVVSEAIAVNEANPLPQVELRMGEPQTLAVKVLSPEGDPVAGVPISFHYELHDAGGGTWSPPVLTDTDGMARFEGVNPASGTYTARSEIAKDYQPFKTALGSVNDPPTVTLRQGYVLEGRVVDSATGWPVPDAEVYAHPEQMQPGNWFTYQAEARTDSEGRFRFSTLPDHACSFGVRETRRVVGRHVFPPGTSEFIELRVEVPEWSHLKARPLE